MGQMKMFGICAEQGFIAVADAADELAKKCNMSRSMVLRTILHDFFNVPTANDDVQKARMQSINKALGRV